MNFFDLVLESVQVESEALAKASPRLVAGVVVMVGFWILSYWGASGVRKILIGTHKEKEGLRFVISLSRWLVIFFGLSISLHVAGLSGLSNKILAGGGILAVAVGFAFKEVGENLIAGAFLLMNRPFKMGDYIKTGASEGVVKSINLRNVHIRSTDGRDIFVPCSQIFRETLENFTLDGLRRFNFTIGVDYKEDLGVVVKDLLVELEAMPEIIKKPTPKVLLAKFDGSWVDLTVSFWVDTFSQGFDLIQSQNSVKMRVKETLQKNNVVLSCDTSSNVKVEMEQAVL